MEIINTDQNQIKPCSIEDIELIASYFSGCSEEFLRSFGADKKKVPPKDKLIEILKSHLNAEGFVSTFAIAIHQGKKIGHCNVNNIIENESGIMHAQIWDEKYRGVGVSTACLAKACEHFIDLFKFKKIIFKVPIINQPANRIMQKLGLISLGTSMYEFSMMIEPLVCNLYEVDHSKLVELKKYIR